MHFKLYDENQIWVKYSKKDWIQKIIIIFNNIYQNIYSLYLMLDSNRR